jgi:hypothetical protein
MMVDMDVKGIARDLSPTFSAQEEAIPLLLFALVSQTMSSNLLLFVFRSVEMD